MGFLAFGGVAALFASLIGLAVWIAHEIMR
jgi:hypothetical protein